MNRQRVIQSLLNPLSIPCVPKFAQVLVNYPERDARSEALAAINERVIAQYAAHNEANPEQTVSINDVKTGLDKALKEEVRRRIVEEGVRPDGRDTTTIRPLSSEVGLIPRVHGSGLFQRGQTQVLSIATLGTPRDSQELDDLGAVDSKRYLAPL